MADTYDLLTLAEAQDVLRVGVNDARANGILPRLITTVSRRLDESIGPTVARVVTNERHRGGRHAIELTKGPVLSISSVTEFQGNTAVTILADNDATENDEGYWAWPYEPDPTLYSGIIVRRFSGLDGCWWGGSGNVAFTYTAGRTSSTTQVDARIKEGAAIMLRNLWRSYEPTTVSDVDGSYDVPGVGYPTHGVPNAVKDLLLDMWQPLYGFGA